MKRRTFIASSVGAAGAMATSPIHARSTSSTQAPKFKMKFAPHTGMFQHHAGKEPLDEIQFMADQGFTAFEDNYLKRREPSMQDKIGAKLAKLEMDMGVFVGGRIRTNKPTLVLKDEAIREEFLKGVKESVDAAKRANATWMTVLPGYLDLKQDIGYQTANVIEVLKRASAILEPHNLVMVLEPLNFFNHPGLFLTKISQAYQICKAVDSPACKILFDIYHQQIQEGNLIPNMEQSWEEIGYFQIGDNPGRKEPTTGEINYKNVFKYIHEKGYRGILGMEHGNAKEGKEGELAVIQAYREVDYAANKK
ncbi:MAG: TIM barrel protein [Saprospiraceae bacterium]|nr:TIM barrel protein [Saprospiraceae bacterium]